MPRDNRPSPSPAPDPPPHRTRYFKTKVAAAVLGTAGLFTAAHLTRPKPPERAPNGDLVQPHMSEQPEYVELLKKYTTKGPHYDLTEDELTKQVGKEAAEAAERYVQRDPRRFSRPAMIDVMDDTPAQLKQAAETLGKTWTQDIVHNTMLDPEHPSNAAIRPQVDAIRRDIPGEMKKLEPLVEKEARLWTRFVQATPNEPLEPAEKKAQEDEGAQHALERFRDMVARHTAPGGNPKILQSELAGTKGTGDPLPEEPGDPKAEWKRAYNKAIKDYADFQAEWAVAAKPYIVALQPGSLERQLNRHVTELQQAREKAKDGLPDH